MIMRPYIQLHGAAFATTWRSLVCLSLALFLFGCEPQKTPAEIGSRDYTSGYKKGRADGFAEGYKKGMFNGRTEGYKKGKINGYKEGYKRGYAEGFSVVYPATNKSATTLGVAARYTALIGALKVLISILIAISLLMARTFDDFAITIGKVLAIVFGGAVAYFFRPALHLSDGLSSLLLFPIPDDGTWPMLVSMIVFFLIPLAGVPLIKSLRGARIEALAIFILSGLTTLIARSVWLLFKAPQIESYLGSPIMIGTLLGGIAYLIWRLTHEHLETSK
jgi:hypothetical protein